MKFYDGYFEKLKNEVNQFSGGKKVGADAPLRLQEKAEELRMLSKLRADAMGNWEHGGITHKIRGFEVEVQDLDC